MRHRLLQQRPETFLVTVARNTGKIGTIFWRKRVSYVPNVLRKPDSWSTWLKEYQYPQGYPKLAAFRSHSDNLSIYRQFRFLFSRIHSHEEVELTELEGQLNGMEKEMEQNNNEDYQLRGGTAPNRGTQDHSSLPSAPSTYSELIDKIRAKLSAYGMYVIYLLRFQKLTKLQLIWWLKTRFSGALARTPWKTTKHFTGGWCKNNLYFLLQGISSSTQMTS